MDNFFKERKRLLDELEEFADAYLNHRIASREYLFHAIRILKEVERLNRLIRQKN